MRVLLLLLGVASACIIASAQELLVLNAPVDFHKSLTHTAPFLFELYSIADDDVEYTNVTFGDVEDVEIPTIWIPSRVDLAVNRDPDVVSTTNVTVLEAVVCMGNLSSISVWADSTNTTVLCNVSAALYHIAIITAGVDVLEAQCSDILDTECLVACDDDVDYNTNTTNLCESVSIAHLTALFENAISEADGAEEIGDEDQLFLLQLRWSKKVANVTTLYTGSSAFTVQAVPVPAAAVVPAAETFPISLIIIIVGVFVAFAMICARDTVKTAQVAAAKSGGAYAQVARG